MEEKIDLFLSYNYKCRKGVHIFTGFGSVTLSVPAHLEYEAKLPALLVDGIRDAFIRQDPVEELEIVILGWQRLGAPEPWKSYRRRTTRLAHATENLLKTIDTSPVELDGTKVVVLPWNVVTVLVQLGREALDPFGHLLRDPVNLYGVGGSEEATHDGNG